MPTVPQRQKLPADVIGKALHIMQITTGKIAKMKKVKIGKTHSGIVGVIARAKLLSSRQRTEVANKVASARWG